MKAIVFGGAGFLGSHAAETLSQAGHRVVVFDAQPSAYLRPNQEGVVGDILNADQVAAAIKGCDVVYNFAGIADIEEANTRPLDTVRVNVLVYRSSKQACELLIDNYRQAFGLPYTILRYGSLYGDRADERNWIYRILKEAVTEGRIIHYGDGEEIREYINVRDAARYSVSILSQEYENQHVIISGHQAIRSRDLLTMIKEMMGGKIEVEYRSPTDKRSPFEPKLHYEVTPYSFQPKIARKLIGRDYLDLGQGILALLGEIYKSHHHYTDDAGLMFAKEDDLRP